MGGTSRVQDMSDIELHAEMVAIEDDWDRMIIRGEINGGQEKHGGRRMAIIEEQQFRKKHSAPAVVRLRFLAGESSRSLDAACAEALGWRAGRDPWWNWHEGPVFDPPGDEWCIRKDGRKDLPCNEALPHFTAESFERALLAHPHA